MPSVLAAYPHSLIASSYSKSLSLPGERIGYIAVNPAIAGIGEIMGGLTLCNRILGFVNAPALMQRAIADLGGVKVDVDCYRRKRDLLCDGLASVGYRIKKPEGAFYLFLRRRLPTTSALPTPSGSGGSSPSPGAVSLVPAISGSPTVSTMRRSWALSRGSARRLREFT